MFAEGRAAEEAKQAGADIVGGIELVEGVRYLPFATAFRSVDIVCRLFLAGTLRQCTFARRTSFEQSRPSLAESWVHWVSCRRSVGEP